MIPEQFHGDWYLTEKSLGKIVTEGSDVSLQDWLIEQAEMSESLVMMCDELLDDSKVSLLSDSIILYPSEKPPETISARTHTENNILQIHVTESDGESTISIDISTPNIMTYQQGEDNFEFSNVKFDVKQMYAELKANHPTLNWDLDLHWPSE